MSYSPYALVEKMSFVRFGGTEAELKAAQILLDEIETLGGKGELMDFTIPKSTCNSFKFTVTAPYTKDVNVKPWGMCDNINADLKFIYAEKCTETDLLGMDDLSDSIVMVNTLNLDVYKTLVKHKAAAIMVIMGKYYHNNEEAGIYQRDMRPAFLKLAAIPTFYISAHDATDLVRDEVETIHVETDFTHGETTSRDVLAVIEGTEKPEEAIVLTAHYDSVPIGTGSWDNATGSAALMGIYNYFLQNAPKRTMRFVWCGSEEQGLYGSKAYVEQKADLLDSIKFCFNFDMCGTILGPNMAFVTGPKELQTFVELYCREIGMAMDVRTGVHSSDSAPFADKGIPAIGLSRGTQSSEIHTCRDLIFPVGEKPLLKNIDFFTGMIDRVVNAVMMPVAKGMPEDMLKELDKYFQREPGEKKAEEKK